MARPKESLCYTETAKDGKVCLNDFVGCKSGRNRLVIGDRKGGIILFRMRAERIQYLFGESGCEYWLSEIVESSLGFFMLVDKSMLIGVFRFPGLTSNLQRSKHQMPSMKILYFSGRKHEFAKVSAIFGLSMGMSLRM